MSVARFNFSHVGPFNAQETREEIRAVKRLREKLGSGTIVALDTKGPDVRIGTFRDKTVTVVAGQMFTFYFGHKYKSMEGDVNGVYVPYDKLLKIVKVGAELCLNDGHVVTTIVEMGRDTIVVRVKAGGVLKNRKSLAAPGFDLQLPFISPEDEEDLILGIEEGVDWVMASDVNQAKNVTDMRAFLKKHKGENIKIMAKIEDQIGLDNLDAICAVCDSVMVARGGLGTDIGLDKLPSAQKRIIAAARRAGKPVVVATEMLESMTDKPNATRAEANDVANAIWDGANYVMLSGESAAGKFPVECVTFMQKVAADAEAHPEYFRIP